MSLCKGASSFCCGLQWADVVLVTEEGSDFDKLKQVRRQPAKPTTVQVGPQPFVAQQKLGQGAFASVYQVRLCSAIHARASRFVKMQSCLSLNKARFCMPLGVIYLNWLQFLAVAFAGCKA